MSGGFELRHGSWGNWRGWLFLGVMLSLLAGMGFLLLPRHPEMIQIGWMGWAWIVVILGMALRSIDLPKGLR